MQLKDEAIGAATMVDRLSIESVSACGGREPSDGRQSARLVRQDSAGDRLLRARPPRTATKLMAPSKTPLRKTLPSTGEGTVRIGGLSSVPAVLRNLGADPAEVLAEVGLDLRLFDDPDNVISFAARGRLFKHCVARTGCQHFGLLAGQHTNASNFGLVGLLARYSPDVGSALRSLVHYLHLHVRGAVSSLIVEGSWAELRYDIHEPNFEATDQLGDGAAAAMFNIMRGLCHPDWRPAQVMLAHRRPDDVAPYRQFFQAPIEFDADRYALVFTADWLRRPLATNDPELRRLLLKQVDALQQQHPDGFPDQVRSVLRTALLTGHGKAEQVAALFSMHSRTLSRRLVACGTSFHELADQCSFELSRQLLEFSDLDVLQIAAALGYADASAFTRAFRRWSGTTPARWRVAQRTRTSASALPGRPSASIAVKPSSAASAAAPRPTRRRR
jgi:AraC-like DNA-binding protein